MTDPVLSVRGIGKRYQLGGALVQDTLRDRLVAMTRRKDPKLRQEIWALRDVSFDVRAGEVVGIIGRNGAGKSTLLKILSRITQPSEGDATIRGRIASLLEVGTGFHPELSGRDNVYLNGAILGMRRSEIHARFDDIVEFAEIEKFLDTPVKHYSSGMYVRLAFAVAAHLQPEILLVDEVLAVGDAAFQRKCLGKMDEVAKTGHTVLFVSHNMGAMARMCDRGILLEHGRVAGDGPMGGIISQYMAHLRSPTSRVDYDPKPQKRVQLLSVEILDSTGRSSNDVDRMAPFTAVVRYAVRERTIGAHISALLDRADGTPVCHSADIDTSDVGPIDRAPGVYESHIQFPGGVFNAGLYQLRCGAAKYGGDVYDRVEGITFELHDHGSFAVTGVGGRQRPGIVALELPWKTSRLGEEVA